MYFKSTVNLNYYENVSTNVSTQFCLTVLPARSYWFMRLSKVIWVEIIFTFQILNVSRVGQMLARGRGTIRLICSNFGAFLFVGHVLCIIFLLNSAHKDNYDETYICMYSEGERYSPLLFSGQVSFNEPASFVPYSVKMWKDISPFEKLMLCNLTTYKCDFF